MKIKNKDRTEVYFKELENGQVFCYDQFFYIKTDLSLFDQKEKVKFNALNLDLNTLSLFRDTDHVTKKKATLIIK